MPDTRKGVIFGAAAYALWGLFPLYWPLLKPSSPVEILAHRMVWSLASVLVILTVARNWAWLRTITRRQIGLLTLAALLVTVNWGVYILAVNTGHVVESSLGYFINPLVNVLFGVVLFRERLRPWQWVAVGLGGIAVVVLTADYGRLPWIALTLAGTFGCYGLIKKLAGVGAAQSMAVETLVLFVPALAYLLVLDAQATATFGNHGPWHTALLVGSGAVTAVPLLLFAAAVNRVPLSVVGMLQYIAPVLQFLLGVLVTHETMPASRWAGFAVVWLALMIFTWDGLRHAAALRRAAGTPAQAVPV